MRSIVKLKTSMLKKNLEQVLEHHFAQDWLPPTDKHDAVSTLITRVHQEYATQLETMHNIALVHRRIPECQVLISYRNDQDSEVQIRLFHDHIGTLRVETGRFLKNFYQKLVRPDKYSFEVPEFVTISEANKNNILDTGYVALNRWAFIRKLWIDRRSEVIFSGLLFLFGGFMFYFVIATYGSPQQQGLSYELIGKLLGPFVASFLLTITNLGIYYSRLRGNTNIIWGVNPAR